MLKLMILCSTTPQTGVLPCPSFPNASGFKGLWCRNKMMLRSSKMLIILFGSPSQSLNLYLTMGNSSSRSSPEEEIASQGQLDLQKNGVLLPPMFGVIGTPSQKGSGPSMSVQARLLEIVGPVSYLQYLQETDLSSIILKDHMDPSVWISTSGSDSTNLRVGARLDKTGLLFFEHALPNNILLQLKAHSKHIPTLSASWMLNNHTNIFVNASNDITYVGGHYDRTLPWFEKDEVSTKSTNYHALDTMDRDTVNIKCGAWMPVTKNSAHGYAALNLLGATAAVHANVDGHSTAPQISTYLSANLNDVDRPPLQITLSKDNTRQESSISVSQVLTFDRLSLNVLEDRAPYVRNTLAWTVQMVNHNRNQSDTTLAEDSKFQSTATMNSLYLGVAWQLNRSVALKAVVDPQQQSVTTALMLKRWKHPRMTCSLLSRFDTKKKFQLVGVNVELETGRLSENPEAYYYSHHPRDAVSFSDDSIPETRAVPKE